MHHQETSDSDLKSGKAPRATNEGRWQEIQHQKFLQAYQQVGDNWMRISDMVRTRSCSQVRSHAQKYFNRKRNDREKIENQKEVIIGGMNDHPKTRRAFKKSQSSRNQSPSMKSLAIKTSNASGNPKKEKKEAGNKKSNIFQNEKTAKSLRKGQTGQIGVIQPGHQDFLRDLDFSATRSQILGSQSEKSKIEIPLCLQTSSKTQMVEENLEDNSFFSKIIDHCEMIKCPLWEFLSMTFEMDKQNLDNTRNDIAETEHSKGVSFTSVQGVSGSIHKLA